MKWLMGLFVALNVWLYRLSGGRVMGRMGAAHLRQSRDEGREDVDRREREAVQDGARPDR